MASLVGPGPEIQAAHREVTAAKPNMNTRLDSSRKVALACEHLDLNKAFFDQSREGIQQLVTKTAILGQAISTLGDDDAGTCKVTVPGRLFGTRQVKKPVAEVNREIQKNLDQEVVQTGLRALGIFEKPKVFFQVQIDLRPSKATLVKAGVATGVAVLAGLGYVARDQIRNGAYAGMNAIRNIPLPSMPSLPTVPSLDSVTNFFSSAFPHVSYVGSDAGSRIGQFVSSNQAAVVGVASAALLAGAGLAIYKAVHHRKSAQQA